MFYRETEQGILLNIRLTPNASATKLTGVFTDADGADFLKIAVVSVPEKGKANKELLTFLAKRLDLAKTKIEIMSGELDRYKRILLKEHSGEIISVLNELVEKENK